MKKPCPAYSGNEPYIFVCYAHVDSEKVYSDLAQLHNLNIHIWYDEGITAGVSWRSEIAAAIKGSSKFIFYISEYSLASTHCLREVDYALNHNIEIIPVYLDDTLLSDELELVLSRVQALYREDDDNYMPHLLQGVRQNTPLIQLQPTSAKNRSRTLVIWLVIALSTLLLILWTQRNSVDTEEQAAENPTAVPNTYEAYLKGAGLLTRWDKEGNLEQAIILFEEATEIDPDFALAYAKLAEAFRIRYALTSDDIWLDKAVYNINKAVQLNDRLAPVQATLGRIHATRGHIDLAFAALENAIQIDANDPDANGAIAKLYARLGRSEDADLSFVKAIALEPENPSIINSYANFLYQESRFQESISQWQKVIRLAPDHYAALLNLGTALDWTGSLSEAITMYERSITLKPTNMAYSNLGNAYSKMKRYKDAVATHKQALEIDDSDWLAWGNLAFVYSRMGDMESHATVAFEQAIMLAEKSRLQNPREVFVHSDLALYYAKTNQPNLALERLTTALTLTPDSTEILASAVTVHELLGQRTKAVEYARKALELGLSARHLQEEPELSDFLNDPNMQEVL